MYFDKLFSDPAFGVLLAILSIWISHLLSSRKSKPERLVLVTKTANPKDAFSETDLVLLNECNRDIVSEDVIRHHPVELIFDEVMTELQVSVKTQDESLGFYKLIRKTSHRYEFEFDIIKKGHGVHIVALHRANKPGELMVSDVKINGIIKDVDFERDDFSDLMIQRANFAIVLAMMTSFVLMGIGLYAALIFLRPTSIEINDPIKIMATVILFLLGFYFSIKYWLSKVGNKRYEIFFKLIGKWDTKKPKKKKASAQPKPE